MLEEFIDRNRLASSYLQAAQNWFIPLAIEIQQHLANIKRPMMIGLNGCQGSGKSTLVKFIAEYLTQESQLNVVTLSIDDFYYDQQARRKLADNIHPLLATRGVPGTHDTERLHTVLKALQKGEAVQLPLFNKATDNPFPCENWPTFDAIADVVIVEGWCWGTPPQASGVLTSPVNDLEKFKDQSYIWREYVNNQIINNYQPLYALMDKWLMLKSPSFEQVLAWRWQQEQHLKSQQEGQDQRAVMDFEQVHHFISYFQRLTEHSLQSLPNVCDIVFELDEHRQIKSKIGAF